MNGLNRTVAIKRMIAEDVSRFQSEARAIAAINHPAKRHFAPEAISSAGRPKADVQTAEAIGVRKRRLTAVE